MRPSDCKKQPLPFKLYVITDRKLFPDRESMLLHFKKLALGLKPGTLAVQVREKDLNLEELLDLTVRIHEAIFPSKIFVNSRWDVALAANADGVHLAESADDPAYVANNYPKMIGVSCHSLERLHSLAGIAHDNRVFATFSQSLRRLPNWPTVPHKEFPNCVRLFAITCTNSGLGWD